MKLLTTRQLMAHHYSVSLQYITSSLPKLIATKRCYPLQLNHKDFYLTICLTI